MRKRNFLIGAFILTSAGILAKVLGAFYKIPLTHILGANGMGVYYLVFPFYSFALIIASGGLSVAVSKLVATERGKFHRRTERKILKRSIWLAAIVSIILSVLTVLLAYELSYLQGNTNAYISYIAIAPAIFFASIVAIIKGYFQGVENMVPSSIALIIGQAGKLVLGLLLAYNFLDYGLEYAVFGAIAGVTLSEVLAMIYLIVKYLVYRNKQYYKFFEQRTNSILDKSRQVKNLYLSSGKHIVKVSQIIKPVLKLKRKRYAKLYFSNEDCKSNKEILRMISRYAIPSTLSSLILPLSVFVDSVVVVNLLTGSGMSTAVATSLYGMSNGIVASLISLPVVLISSLSLSIVPNLSSSLELSSRGVVIDKANFFIKFTWIIVLPIFVLFVLFAPEIIEVLYSGGLSTKAIDEFTYSYRILAISSLSIVYDAFLYTFTAILNALDKPQIPFYSQLMALIVKVVLTLALVSIPSLNVFGLVIANIVFLHIACFGCVRGLKKTIPIRINIKTFLIYPLVSAVVMGLVGYSLKKITYNILAGWGEMVVIGAIIMSIYILLLLSFRIFSLREWEYLPIPKFVLKILPKKFKQSIGKYND